jgi:hypothetical protein
MSAVSHISDLDIMIPAVARHQCPGRQNRSAVTLERFKGPVRIHPEPKNRDLAQEQANDKDHIAHHQRRRDEEIAAIRHKFAHGRYLARVAFSVKSDKLQEKYKKRVLRLANGDCDHWELLRHLADDHCKELKHEAGVCQIKLHLLSSAREAEKIAAITKRRTELSWTCPNDGQAHPFTWQGRQYHQTYDGEMWLTETWAWQGHWAGYYIARTNPPNDLQNDNNL